MVNLELSFFAVEIEKFDFKIDVRVSSSLSFIT